LLVRPPRLRPKPSLRVPFCAFWLRMAPDGGAIDHVLSIIGQPEFNKRFQHGVPNALFGPSVEPYVNRVPRAVSFMQVAPRATDPRHMQHIVEKSPMSLAGRAHRPRPDGRSGSRMVHSSSAMSPRAKNASRKAFLNRNPTDLEIPSVNRVWTTRLHAALLHYRRVVTWQGFRPVAFSQATISRFIQR
jgi:hypothetical protein